HVQPHRLQPVESRDERLEQSHQQVERKVLPAVRVPRELQVVRGASKRSPTYTCSSVHRAATTRIAVTLASSVPHTLADREAPAAASESLSEAVSDGKGRDVASHRTGRADAERHADLATQARRFARVPRPAVVEERRHAHSEE